MPATEEVRHLRVLVGPVLSAALLVITASLWIAGNDLGAEALTESVPVAEADGHDEGAHEEAVEDLDRIIGDSPKFSSDLFAGDDPLEPVGNREWSFEEWLRRSSQWAADRHKALANDPVVAQVAAVADHAAWAQFCVEEQDFDGAIVEYSEAIEIWPRRATLYAWRSLAYFHKGEFDKALADISEALRIDPKHKESYVARAWILATADDPRFRDGARALEAATRACELCDWRDSECLACLAAAHAECGNFAEAVKRQTKALELATPKQNEEFSRQLELYRAGEPLRASRSGAGE